MMHKIKTKYLLRMLIFLVLVIGGMILVYNLFAKDFYIYATKKNIQEFYQTIKTMDLEQLTEKDEDILDDIASQGYVIDIVDDENLIYTSSDRKMHIGMHADKNIRLVNHEKKEYQYDTKAQNKDENFIELKGKIKQNNIVFYVRISMSIRSLDSSTNMNSRFLFVEMIVILLLGIPYSIYLANRTLKPIEKLDEVTKSMMENNYDGGEDFVFSEDEIGKLAERVQNMYMQISNNLIEEKNYNYLLKMQNTAMAEMDIRKRNFIQIATHELKTPLAIISSQIEMMNIDHSEELSEYYDSIMEEIEKMSVLIREMLNTSFTEKIEYNVKLERKNLSEILLELEDKYTLLLKNKKLKIHFNIEKGIYICMNREQIEQALNNFMMNAYEHATPNSIVEISLKEMDGYAYLSVHNQGKNIPEEYFEKIWKSFFSEKQADENSNVGLGLYIVNDIVKYHHGECFAENTSDGVTFTMKFKVEN